MTVRLAESDTELAACCDVMRALRPHVDPDRFVERVRVQSAEGYRIAYVADGDRVVAVAGFRILENLAQGRVLYVDDLVTDPSERSRGHGSSLLSWLVERARQRGCDTLELDSGLQRKDAHRFYEREGMTISSYHFRVPVR